MGDRPEILREVVRRYQQLANVYDRRWRAYNRRTLGVAVDALELSGVQRLLDVGCGTGECARLIRQRFPHVTLVGVDASPDMVAVARQKMPEGSPVCFQIAQAEALPFAGGCFDAVVLSNMLHHAPDPRRILKECFRVLRPQGQLVLVDWCRDFWHCAMMDGWLKRVDSTYVRMYRVAEIGALLDSVRFIRELPRRFLAPPYGMFRIVARKPADALQGA